MDIAWVHLISGRTACSLSQLVVCSGVLFNVIWRYVLSCPPRHFIKTAILISSARVLRYVNRIATARQKSLSNTTWHETEKVDTHKNANAELKWIQRHLLANSFSPTGSELRALRPTCYMSESVAWLIDWILLVYAANYLVIIAGFSGCSFHQIWYK